MTEEKAKARIAALQSEMEQLAARQQQLIAENEQIRDALSARRGAIAVLQEDLTPEPATVTPISEAAPPANRQQRRAARR